MLRSEDSELKCFNCSQYSLHCSCKVNESYWKVSRSSIQFCIILGFSAQILTAASFGSDFRFTADRFQAGTHKSFPSSYRERPGCSFTACSRPRCWKGQHSSLLPTPSLPAVRDISQRRSEPGKGADPGDAELEM